MQFIRNLWRVQLRFAVSIRSSFVEPLEKRTLFSMVYYYNFFIGSKSHGDVTGSETWSGSDPDVTNGSVTISLQNLPTDRPVSFSAYTEVALDL